MNNTIKTYKVFNLPPEYETLLEEFCAKHASTPIQFVCRILWYLREMYWLEGKKDDSPYIKAWNIVKTKYDELEKEESED